MSIPKEELIKRIKEQQAPKSGTMYAVYQTHIEYKTYNSQIGRAHV